MTVTISGIENALNGAVEALLGSIDQISEAAWQNRTADPARPFIMFQHVPTGWTDITVSGGATVAAGFCTITVVIEGNQFTGPANVIADQIIADFPMGRRIDIGGGSKLVITKPIDPQLGFPDGADWRMPLRLDYKTETP